MKQPQRSVKRLPPQLFIADRERGQDPLALAATLPRGTGVILRDYDAPDRPELAAALARLARRHGLLLLVAADAELARRVGAQGLHLPQWRLRQPLPPLMPQWIVTAAVHDRAALARAAARGLDAVLLSPAFPTASHPQAQALGPHRLARLAAKSPLPVYALGGVDARTMKRLPPGLAGVAAIGAFADQKFRRVPR